MRALLITGPVGVGKTTVAEAVGDALAAASVPHAVIDLDRLRQRWPSPADDPFDLELELRNLSAVARNYAEAGAHRLVLAGVLERRADRSRYAAAAGAKLTVCRLKADLSVIRKRLVARHHDSALQWHLNRAEELEKIFAEAWVEDFVGDADQPVAEVAQDVVTGWLAAERV
ncbi:AAA family ATPase [Lentzea sp. NEAU-D13]|uniref:AAA family ATPase n=1 Tax=Lentzea alba TaxID=2714351 RepID=A0A7C9RM96_9PSEU|nr:AAA family ATPase [Lentzea alba]NGY57606.1 AAA family ATPase [Lentzea alba]